MINVEKCMWKHLKIINGIKFNIIEFRKYTNLHENTYTKFIYTIHTRIIQIFFNYTKLHTRIINLAIHDYTIHENLMHPQCL